MKNKVLIPALLLLLTAGLYSCDDIIEKDLSKKSITVLAPSDNYLATTYSQLFWWNEVKGAEGYELQIVKPSFAATQALIVDTTVHNTQFTFTLQPGSYQWRLRAVNGSSQTPYVVYNLTVDSTLDIHAQSVTLQSPADNTYINVYSKTFTWTYLPTATTYKFEIRNGSSVTLNSYTVTPTTGTTGSYTYTFPYAGTFYWRVQAENSYTSSLWSTRTIIVDTVIPAAPVITYLPVNDTTSAQPIPLTWNASAGAATYEVFISDDSTFSGSVHDEIITSPLLYNFTDAALSQQYYWKVRGISIGGNTGPYSLRRKIRRE